MISDKLAILLSRKLSGEATEAELKELESWIKENPGSHYFAEVFQSYWKISPPSPQFGGNPDTHFQYIMDMAEKSNKAATRPRSNVINLYAVKYWKVAVAIVGLLFIGGLSYWLSHLSSAKEMREVAAPRGAKTKVLLPDGSSVWLNSDSKIQFNQKFDGKNREVTLYGEGFFDVVKDSRRPFIVHTSSIDIKVLGTSFNVKSYSADNTIETTLLTGLVEVIPEKGGDQSKILLHPKEKLVYSKTENAQQANDKNKNRNYFIKSLPESKAGEPMVETSWMHNSLVFDGDSFKELAKKMERWFNVTIVFHDEKVAAYRLRGAFKDETIEQALKSLQVIATFKYRIDGSHVEIY